jgi:peptidylprolyl isomerase
MAAKKRKQQDQAARRARAAAAAARRRAARRRRTIVALSVAAVLAVVGVAVWVLAGDDGTEVATRNTTTTPTTAAATSAAGKPCVPVADPLPQGAPAVPVKTGPPPTELEKQDLKEGTGATVAPNSNVTVNYIGVSCSTGKIFDSSYSRNQPATFPLGNVIKGWQDGIPGMKVGGQRLLGIPPAMAYGSQGRPPSIAPDETLWFVVEVLETKAS